MHSTMEKWPYPPSLNVRRITSAQNLLNSSVQVLTPMQYPNESIEVDGRPNKQQIDIPR